MSRSSDLVNVAELIRLAAQTARSLVCEAKANGLASEIHDAIGRIEAATEDLARASRKLDDVI